MERKRGGRSLCGIRGQMVIASAVSGGGGVSVQVQPPQGREWVFIAQMLEKQSPPSSSELAVRPVLVIGEERKAK